MLELFTNKNGELYDELFKLYETLNNAREIGSVCIWNTGTFDVDIINNAVKRELSINKAAINFWEVRDVRSLRQLNDDFGLNNDEWPTSHNAKDDCLRQISYVHSVYGALSERGTTSVGNPGGHPDVPTSEKHTTDASPRQ
jgi:hypothetical protein